MLVPSIRNWFSLVPEPKAEMVVTVPLDGEVADTPGVLRSASNMLARREGIAVRSSGPNRVANPGFRASMRDAAPSTVTICTTGDGMSTTTLDRRAAANVDPRFPPRRKAVVANFEGVGTRRKGGKAQLAFSLVTWLIVSPINALELTSTCAPRTAPPCSSRTVPIRVPVSPWAWLRAADASSRTTLASKRTDGVDTAHPPCLPREEGLILRPRCARMAG